ncbi:MAG: HigA family addiction module antitoxin [Gammaproteobacteria bacterium]
MIKKLKNIHPGEILLEEFLLPMDISQNKLARDIDVPPRRINEIVLGKRSITADTDLRLSRALGTSEGFWLGLQTDYDLEERRKVIVKQLKKIKKLPEVGDECFA